MYLLQVVPDMKSKIMVWTSIWPRFGHKSLIAAPSTQGSNRIVDAGMPIAAMPIAAVTASANCYNANCPDAMHQYRQASTTNVHHHVKNMALPRASECIYKVLS